MDVRLTPAGLPSAPAGVSSSMLVGARAQGESSCPGEMPRRCVRSPSTKIQESRIFDPMRILDCESSGLRVFTDRGISTSI